MKQALTLILFSITLGLLAQTPGNFNPGRYRSSILTVGSDSTVWAMDSIHLALDVSNINEGDVNKWTTTYQLIRDNFYPGSYVMTGNPVDNPAFVNTLYFNKITSWPGSTSQYIRADGSTATFPTSLTPSGSAGGDLTGTYPNPTLTTAGTSGTYGIVTTDSKGRVTSGKRQIPYSGTTDGSGLYTVTFGTAFGAAPNIQANLVGGSTEQMTRIVSVSTTGFQVHAFQRATVLSLALSTAVTNISGATVDVIVTEK